jgi:hypothetical protein
LRNPRSTVQRAAATIKGLSSWGASGARWTRLSKLRSWSCYTAAAKTLLSCLTAPARLLRGTLLWRGPILVEAIGQPALDYTLRQMKPVCEIMKPVCAIKSPGARKGICRGSMPSRLEVRAAGLLFLTAMLESNGNVARQRPRAPQFAGMLLSSHARNPASASSPSARNAPSPRRGYRPPRPWRGVLPSDARRLRTPR